MGSLKENIIVEIGNLIGEGNDILLNLVENEDTFQFQSNYQTWYTKAIASVQSLAPMRLTDFKRFYINYIQGIIVNEERLTEITKSEWYTDTTSNAFYQQISILKAIIDSIDNVLCNINNLIYTELSNSDLESARGFFNSNCFRAAGSIAGIVLERHLKMVSLNHGRIDKKCPTISDYSNHLLYKQVIDFTDSKAIERLGTLRNLCCHDKGREPRKDEVDELIRGIERVIANIE